MIITNFTIMQKQLSLLYVILFSCLNVFSQVTFEKTISSPFDEIITGLGTTSTGEYIISSCQATADTTASLQYTGNLLKMDYNGNLVQRLVFNTPGCFSHMAGLYRDENGIFIYVTFEKCKCRIDTGYVLSLRQFDENLNLISSDSIAYSFMYRYDMTYFRIIRMPQLTIDENNNIFLLFSGITETFDNGTQQYRHIWSRASYDGGQSCCLREFYRIIKMQALL